MADWDQATIFILLNLSVAFDNINHNIFFQRLYTLIGLSDTTLIWFRSYFADHFQSTGGVLTVNLPVFVMAFLGVQYL